jgi:hypothetical protein
MARRRRRRAPKQVRKAINANGSASSRICGAAAIAACKARATTAPGAVSYVLHAAGLLKRRSSGPLMKWGAPGLGSWITVYANSGHTFVVVAGVRYDTSAVGELFNQGSGPRWRSTARSGAGYAARYYPGF